MRKLLYFKKVVLEVFIRRFFVYVLSEFKMFLVKKRIL